MPYLHSSLWLVFGLIWLCLGNIFLHSWQCFQNIFHTAIPPPGEYWIFYMPMLWMAFQFPLLMGNYIAQKQKIYFFFAVTCCTCRSVPIATGKLHIEHKHLNWNVQTIWETISHMHLFHRNIREVPAQFM